MVTINDVSPTDLIKQLSKDLKEVNQITPPEWVDYVKTGAFKQRVPAEKDWWYTRTAAILKSVAKLGPIGVSKLRTKYGGKKNRGHKPERFYKGSGSIIRKNLQQLEEAGLIEKTVKGVHKGKVLTLKGQKFLSASLKKMKV